MDYNYPSDECGIHCLAGVGNEKDRQDRPLADQTVDRILLGGGTLRGS